MQGFRIGLPGKQYGLQKPDKPSIFNEEEESETMKEALEKDYEHKKKLRKVELQHNKMLEEDPTIFDFDGVYEEMKMQEKEKKTK